MVSKNRIKIGKVWFGHTLIATIQKVAGHSLLKPAFHKARHARLAVAIGYVVYAVARDS